jgi:hypothetical protein
MQTPRQMSHKNAPCQHNVYPRLHTYATKVIIDHCCDWGAFVSIDEQLRMQKNERLQMQKNERLQMRLSMRLQK